MELQQAQRFYETLAMLMGHKEGVNITVTVMARKKVDKERVDVKDNKKRPVHKDKYIGIYFLSLIKEVSNLMPAWQIVVTYNFYYIETA